MKRRIRTHLRMTRLCAGITFDDRNAKLPAQQYAEALRGAKKKLTVK
jgi:hypothetical protein